MFCTRGWVKKIIAMVTFINAIAILGSQESPEGTIVSPDAAADFTLTVNENKTEHLLEPEDISSLRIEAGETGLFSGVTVEAVSERYVIIIPELDHGSVFYKSFLLEGNSVNVKPKLYDRFEQDFVEEGVETEVTLNDLDGNRIQFEQDFVEEGVTTGATLNDRDNSHIQVVSTLEYNGVRLRREDNISVQSDPVVVSTLEYNGVRLRREDNISVQSDPVSVSVNALYENPPLLRGIPLHIVRAALVVDEEFMDKDENRDFLANFWRQADANYPRGGRPLFTSLWIHTANGNGYQLLPEQPIAALFSLYDQDPRQYWQELDDLRLQFNPPENETAEMISQPNVLDAIRKQFFGQSAATVTDSPASSKTEHPASSENYIFIFNSFDSSDKWYDAGVANVKVAYIDTDATRLGTVSDYMILNERFLTSRDYWNEYLIPRLVNRLLCNVAYDVDSVTSDNNEVEVKILANTRALFLQHR